MSDIVEVRNPDEARLVLAQGLWLQRVMTPAAATVRSALRWCQELAASGHPLPPAGFVADLGHAIFEPDGEMTAGREAVSVPGIDHGLRRAYEDHLLGKFYADASFARAADALRQLGGEDRDRRRARGLAFLVEAFRQRSGFPAVDLNPAVFKALLDTPPQELLALGWESLGRDGLSPLLERLCQGLIAAARASAEVLAAEDVFELEHGTAFADFADRLALRQVLQAAARLEETLPRRPVRPLAGRQEVPTRVLDEDTYPVGGFSSLSTRGSIESLLHSQLAYMESGDDRPDLFDIKYLRDELLYYSRDENQFLRRRRAFIFALYPDLVRAACKGPDLPYQRLILLLALLLVTVRRLSEWLSADALVFDFVFLSDGAGPSLGRERQLLEMLFREQRENGTVVIRDDLDAAALARESTQRARRSLVHVLTASTQDRPLDVPEAVVTRLVVDGDCPAIGAGPEGPAVPEGEEPFDIWAAALLELLQRWA